MSEQDDGPLTPAEMAQEARKLGHAYLQEQHNVCGVWFLTLADALEAALADRARLRRALEEISAYGLAYGCNPASLTAIARAAIAALVQEQTQGGEPDAPP